MQMKRPECMRKGQPFLDFGLAQTTPFFIWFARDDDLKQTDFHQFGANNSLALVSEQQTVIHSKSFRINFAVVCNFTSSTYSSVLWKRHFVAKQILFARKIWGVDQIWPVNIHDDSIRNEHHLKYQSTNVWHLIGRAWVFPPRFHYSIAAHKIPTRQYLPITSHM